MRFRAPFVHLVTFNRYLKDLKASITTTRESLAVLMVTSARSKSDMRKSSDTHNLYFCDIRYVNVIGNNQDDYLWREMVILVFESYK